MGKCSAVKAQVGVIFNDRLTNVQQAKSMSWCSIRSMSIDKYCIYPVRRAARVSRHNGQRPRPLEQRKGNEKVMKKRWKSDESRNWETMAAKLNDKSSFEFWKLWNFPCALCPLIGGSCKNLRCLNRNVEMQMNWAIWSGGGGATWQFTAEMTKNEGKSAIFVVIVDVLVTGQLQVHSMMVKK